MKSAIDRLIINASKSSWISIALFLIIFPTVIIINNSLIIPSELMMYVGNTSHQLITPGIVCSLFSIIMLIGLFISVYCKIAISEMGISLRHLCIALLLGCFILFISTIVHILIIGRFQLLDGVEANSALKVLSKIMDNLLACTFEEITVRGFLLTQLIIHLKKLKLKGAVLAILISSIFFSINHIPGWVVTGRPIDLFELSILFLISALLALVYIKYHSISMVIGLHFVLNTPAVIFNTYDLTFQLVFLVTVLILIFIPFQKQNILIPVFPKNELVA